MIVTSAVCFVWDAKPDFPTQLGWGEEPKREEKRTKGLRESSEKSEIVNEEEEWKIELKRLETMRDEIKSLTYNCNRWILVMILILMVDLEIGYLCHWITAPIICRL